MKKLLAASVICLCLVSCSNTDEMKVQCVIAYRGGYPDKVLEKAQKYIFDNIFLRFFDYCSYFSHHGYGFKKYRTLSFFFNIRFYQYFMSLYNDWSGVSRDDNAYCENLLNTHELDR